MIKCLIVEDEPLAADILIDYINQVQHLSLVGVASHAIEAYDYLNQNKIDVIFLDIHLPGLKGLDFIKTLQQPPAIFLTTAYHEYAVESYELNVIDYLLKPIEFNRFLQAVHKIKVNPETLRDDKFKFVSESKTHLVSFSEIHYVESRKEYVHIFTSKKTYVSKMTLQSVEAMLDSNLFIRIHRSFIVSLEKIRTYNASEVEIEEQKIPIGGNYRENLFRALRK